MTDRLPSFVIIGAVKAATTWTGDQLRAQGSMFLPMQEPHFFSAEFDRGPDWYANWFAAAAPAQLVGEKSADYLAHPRAAARMAALLPEARLVVQLRNPIDRAYSDYCMLFRRGTVDGRIEDHLTGKGEQGRFIDDGFYHRHIGRFLDQFASEQLLVVLYEDIRSYPETTLSAIGRHVGAPGALVPVAAEKRRNDSSAPMLPLGVRRVLAPLKSAVKPLRRNGLFQAAHRSLARPVAYPPLTADLRRRLRDCYARDIADLGKLLERDLGGWLDIGDDIADKTTGRPQVAA